MQIKNLLTEDRAVSPVIGVILMVAITVILAAVIGTFVLGLGSNVNSTPQAQIAFDYTVEPGTGHHIEVTHEGGSQLSQDNSGDIQVIYEDGSTQRVSWLNAESDGVIQAADSLNATNTSPGTSAATNGTEVRVVWTAPSGGDSATIASSQVPN